MSLLRYSTSKDEKSKTIKPMSSYSTSSFPEENSSVIQSRLYSNFDRSRILNVDGHSEESTNPRSAFTSDSINGISTTLVKNTMSSSRIGVTSAPLVPIRNETVQEIDNYSQSTLSYLRDMESLYSPPSNKNSDINREALFVRESRLNLPPIPMDDSFLERNPIVHSSTASFGNIVVEANSASVSSNSNSNTNSSHPVGNVDVSTNKLTLSRENENKDPDENSHVDRRTFYRSSESNQFPSIHRLYEGSTSSVEIISGSAATTFLRANGLPVVDSEEISTYPVSINVVEQINIDFQFADSDNSYEVSSSLVLPNAALLPFHMQEPNPNNSLLNLREKNIVEQIPLVTPFSVVREPVVSSSRRASLSEQKEMDAKEEDFATTLSRPTSSSSSSVARDVSDSIRSVVAPAVQSAVSAAISNVNSRNPSPLVSAIVTHILESPPPINLYSPPLSTAAAPLENIPVPMASVSHKSSINPLVPSESNSSLIDSVPTTDPLPQPLSQPLSQQRQALSIALSKGFSSNGLSFPVSEMVSLSPVPSVDAGSMLSGPRISGSAKVHINNIHSFQCTVHASIGDSVTISVSKDPRDLSSSSVSEAVLSKDIHLPSNLFVQLTPQPLVLGSRSNSFVLCSWSLEKLGSDDLFCSTLRSLLLTLAGGSQRPPLYVKLETRLSLSYQFSNDGDVLPRTVTRPVTLFFPCSVISVNALSAATTTSIAAAPPVRGVELRAPFPSPALGNVGFNISSAPAAQPEPPRSLSGSQHNHHMKDREVVNASNERAVILSQNSGRQDKPTRLSSPFSVSAINPPAHVVSSKATSPSITPSEIQHTRTTGVQTSPIKTPYKEPHTDAFVVAPAPGPIAPPAPTIPEALQKKHASDISPAKVPILAAFVSPKAVSKFQEQQQQQAHHPHQRPTHPSGLDRLVEYTLGEESKAVTSDAAPNVDDETVSTPVKIARAHRRAAQLQRRQQALASTSTDDSSESSRSPVDLEYSNDDSVDQEVSEDLGTAHSEELSEATADADYEKETDVEFDRERKKLLFQVPDDKMKDPVRKAIPTFLEAQRASMESESPLKSSSLSPLVSTTDNGEKAEEPRFTPTKLNRNVSSNTKKNGGQPVTSQTLPGASGHVHGLSALKAQRERLGFVHGGDTKVGKKENSPLVKKKNGSLFRREESTASRRLVISTENVHMDIYRAAEHRSRAEALQEEHRTSFLPVPARRALTGHPAGTKVSAEKGPLKEQDPNPSPSLRQPTMSLRADDFNTRAFAASFQRSSQDVTFANGDVESSISVVSDSEPEHQSTEFVAEGMRMLSKAVSQSAKEFPKEGKQVAPVSLRRDKQPPPISHLQRPVHARAQQSTAASPASVRSVRQLPKPVQKPSLSYSSAVGGAVTVSLNVSARGAAAISRPATAVAPPAHAPKPAPAGARPKNRVHKNFGDDAPASNEGEESPLTIAPAAIDGGAALAPADSKGETVKIAPRTNIPSSSSGKVALTAEASEALQMQLKGPENSEAAATTNVRVPRTTKKSQNPKLEAYALPANKNPSSDVNSQTTKVANMNTDPTDRVDRALRFDSFVMEPDSKSTQPGEPGEAKKPSAGLMFVPDTDYSAAPPTMRAVPPIPRHSTSAAPVSIAAAPPLVPKGGIVSGVPDVSALLPPQDVTLDHGSQHGINILDELDDSVHATSNNTQPRNRLVVNGSIVRTEFESYLSTADDVGASPMLSLVDSSLPLQTHSANTPTSATLLPETALLNTGVRSPLVRSKAAPEAPPTVSRPEPAILSKENTPSPPRVSNRIPSNRIEGVVHSDDRQLGVPVALAVPEQQLSTSPSSAPRLSRKEVAQPREKRDFTSSLSQPLPNSSLFSGTDNGSVRPPVVPEPGFRSAASQSRLLEDTIQSLISITSSSTTAHVNRNGSGVSQGKGMFANTDLRAPLIENKAPSTPLSKHALAKQMQSIVVSPPRFIPGSPLPPPLDSAIQTAGMPPSPSSSFLNTLPMAPSPLKPIPAASFDLPALPARRNYDFSVSHRMLEFPSRLDGAVQQHVRLFNHTQNFLEVAVLDVSPWMHTWDPHDPKLLENRDFSLTTSERLQEEGRGMGLDFSVGSVNRQLLPLAGTAATSNPLKGDSLLTVAFKHLGSKLLRVPPLESADILLHALPALEQLSMAGEQVGKTYPSRSRRFTAAGWRFVDRHCLEGTICVLNRPAALSTVPQPEFIRVRIDQYVWARAGYRFDEVSQSVVSGGPLNLHSASLQTLLGSGQLGTPLKSGEPKQLQSPQHARIIPPTPPRHNFNTNDNPSLRSSSGKPAPDISHVTAHSQREKPSSRLTHSHSLNATTDSIGPNATLLHHQIMPFAPPNYLNNGASDRDKSIPPGLSLSRRAFVFKPVKFGDKTSIYVEVRNFVDGDVPSSVNLDVQILVPANSRRVTGPCPFFVKPAHRNPTIGPNRLIKLPMTFFAPSDESSAMEVGFIRTVTDNRAILTFRAVLRVVSLDNSNVVLEGDLIGSIYY